LEELVEVLVFLPGLCYGSPEILEEWIAEATKRDIIVVLTTDKPDLKNRFSTWGFTGDEAMRRIPKIEGVPEEVMGVLFGSTVLGWLASKIISTHREEIQSGSKTRKQLVGECFEQMAKVGPYSVGPEGEKGKGAATASSTPAPWTFVKVPPPSTLGDDVKIKSVHDGLFTWATVVI
jgi:hypothetical protein